MQDHLAQANYYRDAANLGEYRSGAHFLPYINNEAFSKLSQFLRDRFDTTAIVCFSGSEGEQQTTSDDRFRFCPCLPTVTTPILRVRNGQPQWDANSQSMHEEEPGGMQL